MPKYIDADELRKNVLKWMPSDPCGREEKEFPFEQDICVSMMMEIEEAEEEDVEPVRHSKWDFEINHFFDDWYDGDFVIYANVKCHSCGHKASEVSRCFRRPREFSGGKSWKPDVKSLEITFKKETLKEKKNSFPKYCSNCGAKMDLKEN